MNKMLVTSIFEFFLNALKLPSFLGLSSLDSAIKHENYALLPIAIKVCYWYYQLALNPNTTNQYNQVLSITDAGNSTKIQKCNWQFIIMERC